jgi:hypothetical protein
MKTTIDMAREAGFNLNFRITGSNEALDRLVDLVRADTLANIDPSKFMSYQEAFEAGRLAEREACALVAEDSDHVVSGRGYYDQLGNADATVKNIAAAIRARGAKHD